MKILPYLEQEINDFGGHLNRSKELESSYRSALFDNFMLSYNDSSMSKAFEPIRNVADEIEKKTEDIVSTSDHESKHVIDYVKEAANNVDREVDTPPQEMKVSREDWGDIKEGLKKRGLKDKDIDELEEKVFSKEGLTYGQMVLGLTSMLQGIKGLNLSPVQQQNVSSVLSKLGFNAQESKKLISDLTSGKYKNFTNAIQKKLASLPPDQQITLSKDEANTITGLFKLSGKGAKEIAALLTKADTKVSDLRNAFSSLKTEMEKMAVNENAKDVKLSELVGKTLHNAMVRESDQSPSIVKMADATTIKDSLGAAKDLASETQAGGNNQNGDKQQPEHKNSEQNAASDSKDDSRGSNHWLDDLLDKSSDSKAWSNFFGKIRPDSDIGTNGLEKIMGAMTNNNASNLTKLTNSAKTNPMWESTARSNVLEQVQNGIYRNLGNGTKQLVLKLNPMNLGNVNVLLQVKNKEINAVIRADNPDSAKFISEHIDKLRAALEQQGLKVDKLDVQTNLADNQTQSSWQGADQHNNAQQNKDSMAGFVKHWRSLNGGGAHLAQDMQTLEGKAIISRSNLHVVA